MLVSLNWLKKYVDIDVEPELLCDRMVMQGFEVESITKNSSMRNVVAAKITQIEKHPDADKLQICQLDTGNGTVQIVTGASNVFVGALVPAALDNSDLPNGTHIKKGKLRGIDSLGMLCSGEELNLKGTGYPGADVYGILILEDKWPVGTDMNAVLGLDDCIVDFKITPNRPDCLSILGIAREVAVALGKPMKTVDIDYTVSRKSSAEITVSVNDFELCPRYVGAAVENIRIAPSPKWLCDCLIAAGMRPINNIVDITNYVMLETGHPMHAFDADDIAQNKIIVRRAESGEKITVLDGKEYELTNEMLVIADGSRAVGLAGIMGGFNSEIKDSTKTIFFECAKFRRDSIRKTARALGIRTEASARFEKGVDIMGTEFALKRALHLIQELNAGDITDCYADVYSSLPEKTLLSVPVARINELLGIDIPGEKMSEILNLLDISCTLENNVLNCTVPAIRGDIEGSADIAEEIIRVYGYDNIVAKPVIGPLTSGKKTHVNRLRDSVKELLTSCGMHEICTYSFISQKAFDSLLLEQTDVRRDAVKILNPLGEDYGTMRTQLVSSMLSVLALNLNRGMTDGRFFEVSKLFVKSEKKTLEKPALCLGITGKNEDFFALKSIVEALTSRFGVKCTYERSHEPFLHPGRQALAKAGEKVIAMLGEIHPDCAEKFNIDARVLCAQVDLEALYAIAKTNVVYSPLPKYPAVMRDLAVVVDASQEIGPMLDAIKSAGGALISDASLFDIYLHPSLGENKKSVAFSITMRSSERTLKDEEANKIFAKAVRSLEYKFGATVRS